MSICHIVGISSVRMDSDQQVYASPSILGEKIPTLCLGSKIFLSRSQVLAKFQGQGQSDFLLIPSVQPINTSDWAQVIMPLWCDLGFVPNSRGNKAEENLRPIMRKLAWNVKFNFLHSRAQLEPWVWNHFSCLCPQWSLIIMAWLPTKHWIMKIKVCSQTKFLLPLDFLPMDGLLAHGCLKHGVAWSFCCIKNFKFETPISVVWGTQSFNFWPEMGHRIMKQLNWACTARGAQRCEKGHFAFQV